MTPFELQGILNSKNRALPYINVHSIKMTLGTFLNYPEERTTQSPTAELEDIRAWYLFRSKGGLRYAFGDGRESITKLIVASLDYKKSYMDTRCTDVELANSAMDFLSKTDDDQFKAIEHLLPGIKHLLVAYRRYDQLTPLSKPSVSSFVQILSSLEHVWFEITKARDLHSNFFAACHIQNHERQPLASASSFVGQHLAKSHIGRPNLSCGFGWLPGPSGGL